VTPDALLALFDETAAAVLHAVHGISSAAIRERTQQPGQYALDLVADETACRVLGRAPVRIVSEESGVHGHDDAAITVVLDPVDGSTNCARGISYWATSLCALDGDGPLAALVANQATGARVTAVRGHGAFRDGVPIHASSVTRIQDALVLLTGLPERDLGGKQFRALGCAALSLCDVAAGGIDGYSDAGPFHAPWDYLGGYLVCVEAGAIVRDARGQPIVTDDVTARRQIIAAGTPELADALMRV
jgi:fructose-1,6-bisphosphatase/inositol monophosphatase family enzyme